MDKEIAGAAEGGGGAIGGPLLVIHTSESVPGRLTTATRPLVLPEAFDRTGSWDEWNFHFECRSCKWLGRRPKTPTTREAFKARFEPESSHTRRVPGKAQEEQRGVGRLFRRTEIPRGQGLQDEARERLALNAYLDQLPQPQIAFSVRQK